MTFSSTINTYKINEQLLKKQQFQRTYKTYLRYNISTILTI